MRKSALVAALFAGAALSLLPAAAPSPAYAADNALITTFSSDTVTGLLKEMGATNIEAKAAADGTQVIVHQSGDLGFAFVLTACKSATPGCLGLSMMARFGSEGAPAYDLTTVNGFNATYVFAQAHVFEKDLYLTRYVIADGGISRENLRSNIGNFWGMPAQLQKYFKTAGVIAQGPVLDTSQVSLPTAKPAISNTSADQRAVEAAMRTAPLNRLNK